MPRPGARKAAAGGSQPTALPVNLLAEHDWLETRAPFLSNLHGEAEERWVVAYAGAGGEAAAMAGPANGANVGGGQGRGLRRSEVWKYGPHRSEDGEHRGRGGLFHRGRGRANFPQGSVANNDGGGGGARARA